MARSFRLFRDRHNSRPLRWRDLVFFVAVMVAAWIVFRVVFELVWQLPNPFAGHRGAVGFWVALGFIVYCYYRRSLYELPAHPGTCLRCGYDLRTTRFRCPECGDVWMIHERRRK